MLHRIPGVQFVVGAHPLTRTELGGELERCRSVRRLGFEHDEFAVTGNAAIPFAESAGGSGCGGWSSENLDGVELLRARARPRQSGQCWRSVATRIASMSASHASLTDIPAADVAHTDAKWTPVRNHFGITAFGVNAYTARNTGDRLIGEHDHADPTDEQHQELYFVHTGHARFQVDGQDVDAPAGTFVSALDVKTIRSAVALSDNTVVLVIGAEPGAPYEVTPAERAELAAAGLPATPA